MAYQLTTCQLCKPVEDFQLSIITNEEKKSLDGGQGDRQCGKERWGNKLLDKKLGSGGGNKVTWRFMPSQPKLLCPVNHKLYQDEGNKVQCTAIKS